jgi:hypothetical protein
LRWPMEEVPNGVANHRPGRVAERRLVWLGLCSFDGESVPAERCHARHQKLVRCP